MIRLLGYALIGVVILMFFVVANDPEGSGELAAPAPAKVEAPSIDRSPEKQAAREKLIGELQARGIFANAECRGMAADVWVRPAFTALDFEDKQSFVSVVYAWCHENTELGRFVRVRDVRTNNELGMYTADFGLKLE